VSTSGIINRFPLTLISASTSSYHAHNPTLSDQAIMKAGLARSPHPYPSSSDPGLQQGIPLAYS
jgi:hypothetical protein